MDVNLPDGRVLKGVPEGTTKAEIAQKLGVTVEELSQHKQSQPESANMQSVPQKQFTPTQQYMANVAKGVPFGLDIASTLGAAVYGDSAPNVPFNEKRIAAKNMMEQAAQQGQEQMPVLSTIGGLSTGAPVGMMMPQSAYQAPSTVGRFAKGAMTAAGLGAMYGAGEGQGLEERAINAIKQGAISAPIGGIGAVAGDIISAGWNGGRSLAQKASTILNRARQPQSNITVTATGSGTSPQGLTPTVAAPSPIISQDVIPLTKGQATQNQATQSLEFGAQAGNFGEEAQRMALEARDLQNEAAKKAISNMAGGNLTPEAGLQAATELKNTLSQSYKAAKARTTSAYNNVAELSQDGQLQIAGDFIKGSVVPALDDFAQKGFNGRGFDLNSPKMSNAKRLYEQVNKFKDIKNIKTVDFFKMEDWRGRLSQGIAEADKGSPEKAFLSGLLDRYDVAMEQLPREAIVNGDEAIIGAMEKARITRKEQGVLFERSKLVKDIVTNDDLTNEQFYNTITSLGSKSGTYVRDMLRTAAKEPEKQAALKGQIKQSVLGSILNKSLSAEVKAGGSVDGGIEKMVSFDKLETNLKKLMDNKTLYNQVLSAPEREQMQKVYNAISLIKSTKPSSKNYSNTAYTLFNFLRGVSPTLASANIFGVGLGSGLQAAGKSGASNELAQALAPVLNGILEENTGAITNFGQKYGRQIMGAGLSSAPPLRITVTPQDRNQ